MGGRVIDPRQQFSKKLAGRAEWFWFGYMLCLSAIMYLRPEVAMPVFYMACLVTIVMFTTVLAYTDNSKYEKGLWSAQELAKIKFNWKGNGTQITADRIESKTDKDEPEESYEDEWDDPDEGETKEGEDG